MIKARLPLTHKEYLLARDADRMTIFMADEGRIRGAYVQANLVVREMAANHQLGAFETYALGQGYVAALLMASTLKGEDYINLNVQTDGPAQGFTIDSNGYGTVRGHLYQQPFRVPEDWTSPTMEQIMGEGLLHVTRYVEDKKVPVTGSVRYGSGSLAMSLAQYYDQSEQIPTAFVLSLPFDREGRVLGAGGLVLQAMPGYDKARWEAMAGRLYELPSIGENATESHDPAALLSFWFSDFEPKVLDSRRVEFFCACSKEKFSRFLAGLPLDEQTSILREGPFPLVTTCHNCASKYEFTSEELVKLWGDERP